MSLTSLISFGSVPLPKNLPNKLPKKPKKPPNNFLVPSHVAFRLSLTDVNAFINGAVRVIARALNGAVMEFVKFIANVLGIIVNDFAISVRLFKPGIRIPPFIF